MNAEERKVVLLVDDTPANIQIANSILKDTYRIRIAMSGAKALELANSEPRPDLILLDVMMPEMDGFEVCSRLKAAPATNDIPVIFLTAQTEAAEEARGFEVGGVDYIHKPFSPAIMKARVHTHLVLRGIREQLAEQLIAIRTEMETARQIQLSILPCEIPKIAGLDIAARYVPMTAVAGDFYDFIRVDEHRLGVLVADVSGHGMPAALISSMLKIALAAQTGVASDPARVLCGLNRSLCGKFQGHYVTAAYVLVDREKKCIRYAGAGHPPLLLGDQSSAGTREVIENGLFLGLFPEGTYSAAEVPFDDGDWAVLYTDGVLEMTNRNEEEFGAERFHLFLKNNRDINADQFVDKLLDDLSGWADRASGRETEDDLTLLAIRCHDGQANREADIATPSAVLS